MRAIVWDGSDLALRHDVELREPGAGEVVVRVLASGICHSDLNAMDGTSPRPVPIVLGHEAAGTVEAVGVEVDASLVGQPVVVGCARPCGSCRRCVAGDPARCPHTFVPSGAPFTRAGSPVWSMAGVSSFAERIVVRADQVVAADGLAPRSAALVGCAVSTGYGVARRVARVEAGDTVVVFGVGGIGVNALQTCRLLGAARIVAVDVDPSRAEVATSFGADVLVTVPRGAGTDEVAALIAAAAGSHVDVAIECSGAPSAIAAALAVVGVGGVTALVGIPTGGATASFDVYGFLRNRQTIVGSMNGGIDPGQDLATIVALARDGRLDLDRQVSGVWPMEDFEDALAALRGGRVVRAVLDLSAGEG